MTIQLNDKANNLNAINAKQMKSLVEGNSFLFVVQNDILEAVNNALLFTPPTNGSMAFAANPQKLRTRLLYIADILSRSRIKALKNTPNRTEEIKNTTNLKASYLKKILGDDYKKYLEYLIDAKIIESDNRYWHNEHSSKSKGYSFLPNYDDESYSIVIINDKQFKSQLAKNSKSKSDKYEKLYNKLDDIDINYTRAKDILNKDLASGKFLKIKREISILSGIKKESTRVWKTGKTNRLYTPLCCVQKSYRQCLSVGGNSLVGIDISNSLPLIIILLFSKNKREIEELINDLITTSNRNLSSNTVYTMWDMGGVEREDVAKYKEMVKNGTLYTYLLKAWERDLNYLSGAKYQYLTKNKKINKTKKKLLSILFRPERIKCKYSKWLEQRFPTIMNLIWFINTGYTKMRNGKGYNEWKKGDLECPLARVLQSIEAYIILDLICGNLLLSNSYMPIYTIHDCIVTTMNYVNVLKERIEMEYFEIFKFKPKTKLIVNWELD